MFICLIKVTSACVRIANVDMNRVSFPVHASTTRLALKDGEYIFISFAGVILFAEGGKGISALEECGAHAQLGDANGEEFQSCGVCEAGGCGIFFVLWVEDWVVFGLQLHLITIPKSRSGNLNRLISTPQSLLSTCLGSLRQLPLTKLTQTQTSTSRLPQQQTKPQCRPSLRQPITTMFHRSIILIHQVLLHINLRWSLILTIVILRE
mmetsp:Transcript_24075/g.51974  ORF Transcript_24075/g.51974 Transcript_24075/m.51974 type:complete len:208 (-) Transcript_24075:478-1101(-)